MTETLQPTLSPRALQFPPTRSVGAVPVADASLPDKIKGELIRLEQTKARLNTLRHNQQKAISPIQKQTLGIQMQSAQRELLTLAKTLGNHKSQWRVQGVKNTTLQLRPHQTALKECVKQLPASEPIQQQIHHFEQDLSTCSGQLLPLYQAPYAPSPEEDPALITPFLLEQLHKMDIWLKEQPSLLADIANRDEQYRQTWKANQLLYPLERMALFDLGTLLDQLIATGFVLKEQLKPILHSEPEALTHTLGGELTVQFDLERRQSVVRNQLGVEVTEQKMPYESYLSRAFEAIDQVTASQFSQLEPLKQAIEDFLEAISLQKERYEAYFGLGYLYALVREPNNALYFLQIAEQISQHPMISQLIAEVKNGYHAG